MFKSGLVRGVSLIAAAAALLGTNTAQAQGSSANTLFPNGLSGIEKNRMFMRLGYTNAFIKTKSGDAYDTNGPLVTSNELLAATARANAIFADCDGATPSANCLDESTLEGFTYANTSTVILSQVSAQLVSAISYYGGTGLGTPQGVQAKSQKSAGTPTLSLGYWLDDEYKWTLEAFLLAVPLDVTVYGKGTQLGSPTAKPNGINGKPIVTTKLLPPLVIGSYNFGDKESLVRPYLGLGAMYAVFFNTKTTALMDQYVGGKTTVSTSNAFGVGPFAGLQSKLGSAWNINLSVGQVKIKTTATLTTNNSVINSGAQVLKDYPTVPVPVINGVNQPGNIAGAINIGDRNGNQTTSVLTRLIADTRGASNLGTATRKQDLTLTNTIVTLSIGRSF